MLVVLTVCQVLYNMRLARRKGVETIFNPAPAIALPDEAYQGLDHLIVNQTEAIILSGIKNTATSDDIAAIFISRGVKNVIITLGGEVRRQCPLLTWVLICIIGCLLQDGKATDRVTGRTHRARTESQGC